MTARTRQRLRMTCSKKRENIAFRPFHHTEDPS